MYVKRGVRLQIGSQVRIAEWIDRVSKSGISGALPCLPSKQLFIEIFVEFSRAVESDLFHSTENSAVHEHVVVMDYVSLLREMLQIPFEPDSCPQCSPEMSLTK